MAHIQEVINWKEGMSIKKGDWKERKKREYISIVSILSSTKAIISFSDSLQGIIVAYRGIRAEN
jgi:hypothetical protein